MCPRCDTTTRFSSARFCNRCRVYLCPACSRKKRCPSKDPTHRARAPALPKAWWMGLFFAVFMLPFGALMYSANEADRAYAEMPVTPVASLAPGNTAKVNGTLDSAADPVIYWTGSSRSGHWIVEPFNVTDATGSIRVDVSRIDGEDSSRIVQSGVHGRQWRPGDSVSVIGEVRLDGTGNVSLLATRVARTPTSFYRPDSAALPLFFVFGVGGAGIAGISLSSRARLRRDHEAHATGYPHRLTDWRVCMNCGDRVLAGEPHCPACGSGSLREPIRNSALRRLPTLDLGTHFGQLSLAERAVTVAFTLVVPVALMVIAIWLASIPGFGFEGWLILVMLAVIFPVVFGAQFLKKSHVLLGPETVEDRSLRRSRGVATSEIDRALTVRQPTRIVHFLFNRGGLFVAFGPGLRTSDFDVATQWVRGLVEVAGVPYREASSLQEAMVVAYRDS